MRLQISASPRTRCRRFFEMHVRQHLGELARGAARVGVNLRSGDERVGYAKSTIQIADLPESDTLDGGFFDSGGQPDRNMRGIALDDRTRGT